MAEFAFIDVPARIANLAFRLSAPGDWTLHDLPAEDVDFSTPTNFFPLAVLTAPWAAVALTIAARPGFEDGTVQDWSLFLLSALDIQPTVLAPAQIGNVRGLAGIGRQHQEGTWLQVRFAFFEDGGRLVHLGLIAPEAIGSSLENVWKNLLDTFALDAPQGPTAEIGPGMGILPEPLSAAEPPPAVEPEPVVEPAQARDSHPKFQDTELGFYAKSADAATLDPEHPVNARIRDQGIALVPRVHEVDLDARTAKLGAGAIQANIRVALGWHVNDDGKRTLLLDPEGKIQISLHLLATQGRTPEQILDAIQQDAQNSYENPEFLRLTQDGIWGLAVRNIAIDNEPIHQIHLLTRWRKNSTTLRARVTCDPESMRYAVDYADLVLKSAEYFDHEEVESDGPEWWHRALVLERQDRLAEAEQLLRDAIPDIHCAIQIAQLYKERWLRLREIDPSKASDARQQAWDWAGTYASWATSGGEGLALSRERDLFRQSLGSDQS